MVLCCVDLCCLDLCCVVSCCVEGHLKQPRFIKVRMGILIHYQNVCKSTELATAKEAAMYVCLNSTRF